MTVMQIVICALGTVTKILVLGLEDLEIKGRAETIQTPALLVWFVWFYGISTFVGYSTPNPFLCK